MTLCFLTLPDSDAKFSGWDAECTRDIQLHESLTLLMGVSITDTVNVLLYLRLREVIDSLDRVHIFSPLCSNNILNPRLYDIYMTLPYICLPIYLYHWPMNSWKIWILCLYGQNIGQCPVQSKISWNFLSPSFLTDSSSGTQLCLLLH